MTRAQQRRDDGAARHWLMMLFICSAVLALPGRAAIEAQTSPNSLEIRGAGTFSLLARPMAELYMTDHPESTITITTTATNQGLKGLIVKTCEMAMATDEISEDIEKLARDKQVKLKRTDVYRDALVVVVPTTNPVSDLTLKQVKDIFRGAVTNWKEVGGEDKPIEILTMAPTSATYEVFKRRVLGDDAVMSPKATVLVPRKGKEMIHDNTISYGSGVILQAWGVKTLTIDGVAASAATIQSGKYPIVRMMSLYQREPGTPIGNKLVDYFLAPDKGQKAIVAAGNVPAVAP